MDRNEQSHTSEMNCFPVFSKALVPNLSAAYNLNTEHIQSERECVHCSNVDNFEMAHISLMFLRHITGFRL